MIFSSGLPTWAIVLLIVMFAGQVRSFIDGGSMRKRNRLARMAEMNGFGGLGRADVERLESAIGERDGVIEDLQRRLSEMESRLDFAERLITEKSPAAKL